MQIFKRPELLAPAGDAQSLAAALGYGANAVYLGAKSFGMRAKAANFDEEALSGAAALCHRHGAKLYLTCNTLPRGAEIDALPDFLRMARQSGADALIVSDIGVMALAKRIVPEMPLHVSTQFGVVNYLAARELYEMGAQRIVLARELCLDEIAEIRAKTPPGLILEAFVHGAMCVSVSGRCVLSNYMTGRDANRGACAQPCRWRYALMESERPGRYFPVYEEDGYSYILNANDLCMIGHLDKLAGAGVSSMKIEGRAKSAYYVAAITGAYRQALDLLMENPVSFHLPDWLRNEVEKVSHRPYSTGFYLPESKPGQDTVRGGYNRPWQLVATIDGYEDGCLLCTERNRFARGERLEVLCPDRQPTELIVEQLYDEEMQPIQTARHPMMRVRIPCASSFPPGSMLRRQHAEPVPLI